MGVVPILSEVPFDILVAGIAAFSVPVTVILPGTLTVCPVVPNTS